MLRAGIPSGHTALGRGGRVPLSGWSFSGLTADAYFRDLAWAFYVVCTVHSVLECLKAMARCL